MDKHPLDELDRYLDLIDRLDFEAVLEDEDEIRYVAEHKAVRLNESSTPKECAYALCRLASVHLPQLNTLSKDKHANRHYANPVEMIREEKKLRDNKKIWYTGNVAAAHARIKDLEGQIVNEDPPEELRKTAFWGLVIGLISLVLGILSVTSGAAVELLTELINSTFFYLVFTLAVLGFSLFFGFFAIGIVIVGAVLLLGWIVLELPGLATVLLNAIFFLVAIICLWVAYDFFKNSIQYKPLPEEEHERNQQRIKEKETLCSELKEYSRIMLSRLDLIRGKLYDHNDGYLEEMRKHLSGITDVGVIHEILSFLKQYYKKMTR